jgi:hypothetical protein
MWCVGLSDLSSGIVILIESPSGGSSVLVCPYMPFNDRGSFVLDVAEFSLQIVHPPLHLIQANLIGQFEGAEC